jgi:hypothetical protein
MLREHFSKQTASVQKINSDQLIGFGEAFVSV